MKIGISGPVTLSLLNHNFNGQYVPSTRGFPLISHLVNGILKQGHQVIIYTLSDEVKEPTYIGDEQLRVCIGRYEPHPGRDLFKSERKDLVELMKKYPADIINAHWSYEYAWAAIDSSIPTIVSIRDHATTILKYQFIPYRITRWLMNLIVLNKAKYLTTNSNYLWELLTKRQQKKASVINNFYKSGLEKHYLDSSNKQDYIVSVNNGFNKRKNVENGLLAFSILRKKYTSLKYYVIGTDMEAGGTAENFAIQHQLTDNVIFMGNKPFDEVIDIIKHAKVMLHTSREESFGNVVLEAMVVGTPVVGGNKSGNIPFLLDNGNAGILCDVNSPENIVNAMESLLADLDFSNQIRKNAYSFATNQFSEKVIIDRYIETYIHILNENKYIRST